MLPPDATHFADGSEAYSLGRTVLQALLACGILGVGQVLLWIVYLCGLATWLALRAIGRGVIRLGGAVLEAELARRQRHT